MSVRSRRLIVAGVTVATVIALPAAALASDSITSSGKPTPAATASESAAAGKSAARQSGALRSATEPAMVTALATQLGVSHSAAQRAVIDTELRPCLVHVDPAGVDHAVSNLVDNAIKWSPPEVAVRVVVENGRVLVSDQGPGIAPEDLPHIFERFYRAPDARGMPGAGLGLAIVGSVTQANDGTVEVQTGPGGSTFVLAFPPLRDLDELPADQQD